ncbi:MAG: hypothetical protein ACKN87_13945, partial [Microcystis aeruginosa]
ATAINDRIKFSNSATIIITAAIDDKTTDIREAKFFVKITFPTVTRITVMVVDADLKLAPTTISHHNIGRFVVDRRSYYDSGRIREFDAIVNGSRERWWANCRGGELGSGSRRIRSSREIDRVVDFVCEDRG